MSVVSQPLSQLNEYEYFVIYNVQIHFYKGIWATGNSVKMIVLNGFVKVCVNHRHVVGYSIILPGHQSRADTTAGRLMQFSSLLGDTKLPKHATGVIWRQKVMHSDIINLAKRCGGVSIHDQHVHTHRVGHTHSLML